MTDIAGNETLRDLWQSVVDRKGDRQFLTFHNRVGDIFEYTYSEFDQDVNRIANVFLSLNIKKGDHVALQLHSSPEFLMCLFGLSKIGAIVVPVNEQYLSDEAEYILRTSGAVCAVTEPLFFETYEELLKRGLYFPKGLLVARAGSDSPESEIDFFKFYTKPGEEKEAFEERFGVKIMNTYGSTESIGWVLTDPPVGKRNWPSVGRPGLGYEVRIADMNDEELPHGEVGEIQIKGVRGRSVMLEYFNNPKATEETFTEDGWLKTGDQGYQDDNGWFFFVDRKSNMVKCAGENISTTEIEEILCEHSNISEAAVIGVDDPIRDQAIKAFVLPLDKSKVTIEELKTYCESKMTKFKVPTYFEIVDEFSRTCSLKIEKKLLK